MQVFKKSILATALALSLPLLPSMAQAQTTQELKAELDALKAHVKKLEQMIEKQAQAEKPAASSEEQVEVAEFNRIRVKTEGLEDAIETNGLKDLKISGYFDPSYIYNRNAKSASFVFLNNNSAINGSTESFGYDNTYFGSAMLNIDKEIDGGSRVRLSLMPSKSTASGYNYGNLVHEASLSVPLDDPATRLIAGQLPDWSGYEYIPSNQNKLITHNLLFDFSAPNFYTGVGMEVSRGKWLMKGMIGNMNRARIDTAKQNTPGLFYRVDYAKGEYAGFGFSGAHSGFDDKSEFGRLDLLEIDGYFIRADLTLQGQLSYGRQKSTDFNGYRPGHVSWWGLSGLAAYKLTQRLEGIARLDYINNSRNGGGLLGSTFGGMCKDLAGEDANCPDGRNGFGSSMEFDGTNWLVTDPSRGTNRFALSLGLNYALMPGVNVKGEYRYDRANGRVFINSNGEYVHENHVFGLSTVISF